MSRSTTSDDDNDNAHDRTSDEYLRELLETNREMFERIADDEELPRWARRKYGERLLALLDDLSR